MGGYRGRTTRDPASMRKAAVIKKLRSRLLQKNKIIPAVRTKIQVSCSEVIPQNASEVSCSEVIPQNASQ
ncbi:hypothetical protein AVEN_105011-1, partial [Araneus ventricosus]